jgi:hypothetical protein
MSELDSIEALAKTGSTDFLLSTLVNCQKIEVINKFFYDAILEEIESKLETITKSSDLVKLGFGLGMNKNFSIDNKEFIRKFYAHVFGQRFMLTHTDRELLNSVFMEIEVTKIYQGHLDLFKDIRRSEAQKMALKAVMGDVETPEHLSISFDFENKVVLVLNKTTQ